MSNFKLHISVLSRIETLSSDVLKEAVKSFIKYTPIDFTVVSNGALRTAATQNALFKRGVSQLDGYKYKSAHQSGLAIDLVPWVDGVATWDITHTSALGAAFRTYCKMRNIDVTWGGDWNGDGSLKESFFDPCHFEVKE